MLGEVWESVLGCGGGVGGMKNFWGKCGKVCCGMGKVRGNVGRNVGGVGKCVGYRKVC